MKRNGSILDSLMQEVSSLDKTLGPGDRTKLTEYLESVREIEQRIQSVEARGIQSIVLPERPTDVPATLDEHIKLMYDLQALGFQADITRVFTMIVCRELKRPIHWSRSASRRRSRKPPGSLYAKCSPGSRN